MITKENVTDVERTDGVIRTGTADSCRASGGCWTAKASVQKNEAPPPLCLSTYPKWASGLRSRQSLQYVGLGSPEVNPTLGRQRRGYGRLILALALAECRQLRIGRVLVTCDDENVASARIIEANGGVLENVIRDPAGRGRLRRYWISL